LKSKLILLPRATHLGTVLNTSVGYLFVVSTSGQGDTLLKKKL